MPQVQKLFTLTITPEQFVNSCDIHELEELELEIDRRRRREVYQSRYGKKNDNTLKREQ